MKGIAEPNVPHETQGDLSQDPNFQGEGDDSIGAGLTEEQATPEEQGMYDALVEPMLGMVHGDQTKDQILSALKGGSSIGQLTYQIATAVIGEIEKQGRMVPDDILQMAAEDVVEDLVDISVSIGKVKGDDKSIEQAFVNGLMEAIDLYGQEQRKSGKVTPEQNKAHYDKAMEMGGFSKNPVAAGVQEGVQNV